MEPRVQSAASIVAICISLVAWNEAGGASYYVSTTGSDTAAGTLSQPWRTIQRGANAAAAGDTVHVRGGVYEERLTLTGKSGTATQPIIIRSYEGETAVLDQNGVTPPNGASALIRLHNCSHIIIQGLELRNYKTAVTNKVPIGVLVSGGGSGVKLLGNKIHAIWQSYAVLNSFAANAHGVLVSGNAATAIIGFVMEGNEVYDLRLGASEAVALNGNVTHFVLRNNIVRDCNNIGIDFIGHEGTNSNASLDVARNGLCVGNVVFNIDSQYNPAYGGNFTTGGGDSTRAAAGIYVDGGADILIERNHVYHCNFGIEVGSEHNGKRATGITVRNNLVRRNHVGGIFIGGYAASVGGTTNSTFTHNTLYQNDTSGYGGGQIALQHNITTTQIKHNIMVCNSSTGQFVLKTNTTGSFAAGAINWNVYSGFNSAFAEFIWQDVYREGFAAWRSASGQDANSLYVASVGFSNAAAADFTLLSTSPAVDAGDPAFSPAADELDFNGRVRRYGTRVDIGMSEFGSPSPGAPQVQTLDADGIGYFTGTLRGSVDTLGLEGKCWFEYGPTIALGKKSAVQIIPVGALPLSASLTLTGLPHWKDMYFRVVGSSGAGTNRGQIRSFRTQHMSWTLFEDDPLPAIVHPGEPVLLTTSAIGGEPIIWAWRKNGVTIAGAVTDQFQIASATAADAASYQARIHNAVSSSISAPVPVVVVGNVPSDKLVNETGTLVLGADFAGPATQLTFEWQKDGQPLQNSQRISGAASARLTVKSCAGADAGAYRCVIRQRGVDRTAGVINVSVRLRPVMNPFVPSQPWIAGSPVSEQLGAVNSPTRFHASGLPKGVTLNANTGTLTGKPATAKSYTLRLSASNAAGRGPELLVPITVGAPAAPAAAEFNESFTWLDWLFTPSVKSETAGGAELASSSDTSSLSAQRILVKGSVFYTPSGSRVEAKVTERGSVHLVGRQSNGWVWTRASVCLPSTRTASIPVPDEHLILEWSAE